MVIYDREHFKYCVKEQKMQQNGEQKRDETH